MREIVIMNDVKSLMLSYYVIYYEKFKKVMHQTEKVTLTTQKKCINYYAGDICMPLPEYCIHENSSWIFDFSDLYKLVMRR